MSKLADFWNNEVSRGHRHIAAAMSNGKKDYHIKRFEDKLLKYIPKEEIKASLDWGCGGGLIAKELAKFSDVYVLDISENSIAECEEYVGADNLIASYVVPNISEWKIPDIDIDLIHCEAVIHHFPSVDYWRTVANVWIILGPKYIAIQTKWADKNIEQNDYYSKSNYITGLQLSIEEVKETLSPYKCIHLEKTKAKSGADYAFFVFRRRLCLGEDYV